jgi:hypothetical protein
MTPAAWVAIAVLWVVVTVLVVAVLALRDRSACCTSGCNRSVR